MNDTPTMATFDPWTASAAEAASAAFSPGMPEPLAQHYAAQTVLQARGACMAVGGGLEVMRCMRLCASNKLTAPEWLAAEFARRHSLVEQANVGTWDEAFGKPWPGGEKRLAAARQRMRLRAIVHGWVFRLAIQDNDLPINTDLFERIGKLPEVNACASRVATLYYESLSDGHPNVAALR